LKHLFGAINISTTLYIVFLTTRLYLTNRNTIHFSLLKMVFEKHFIFIEIGVKIKSYVYFEALFYV